MIARCLRHRAPVLWLLLPFMGGVILGRCLPVIQDVGWWLGGAVLLAGASVWRRDHALSGVLLMVASLTVAGASSYQLHRKQIPDWASLPPREITADLELLQLYASQPDSRTCNGIARILSANDPKQELTGQKVHVSLRIREGREPPSRGARVTAVAVISAIPNDSVLASFDGYLISAGINFRLKRGSILGEETPPGAYARARNALAKKFRRHLQEGIDRHHDIEGIYAGMVLGQASAMSDEQKRLFSRSGTMHLFSVGGLHVGVVAMVVHVALGLCRLGARWRAALLLPVLWCYVDLTGGSPAAMRAFWIALFVEAGLAFDRPVNSLSTLAAAALLSVLGNPLHVFSASFQFSYAIAAAILLLGVPLAEAAQDHLSPFKRLPEAIWTRGHHFVRFVVRAVVASLVVSLTAALTSEICSMLYFGLGTPGAMLANLVMMPLSSLVIIAGILALAFGSLGIAILASLMNHAAALVLKLIVYSLDPYVAMPGVAVPAAFSSPSVGFAALVGMLGILLLGYTYRWRPMRWWVPLPFALGAAGLVILVRPA